MKPRRIIFLIAFLISGLAFSLGQDILACTLFAAAGSSVQGGGVLVMTAGVNEKGLVIVNAAASIVPHRSRRHLRLEKIFRRPPSPIFNSDTPKPNRRSE